MFIWVCFVEVNCFHCLEVGRKIANSLSDLSKRFLQAIPGNAPSPLFPFFPYTFISTEGAAGHQLCHAVTGPSGGGGGGVQACTLYRCPLQKVMVWDNYPSTSTCLLKMADSAVVGFQCETVVIRIWISFHSHSGSHPDNTWLTKSTRWNWPVSSISRAICATQPWITAMGENLLSHCWTRGA